MKRIRHPVVYAIILINVIVAVLGLASSFLFYPKDPLRLLLSLRTDAIATGRWWEFFTYMWVHADPLTPPHTIGLMHILFNMLALWMFGRAVEERMGPWPFLAMYISGGIVAAWAFLLEYWIRANYSWELLFASYQEIVGASGAVLAVAAMFSMLYPKVKLFIIPIPFPVKARFAIAGFVLISFVLLFVDEVSLIGHSAHIGGMFAGYVWALLWKPTSAHSKPHPQEGYSKEPPTPDEIREITRKYSLNGLDGLDEREREILYQLLPHLRK